MTSAPQLEVLAPQTPPERLREIAYLHPELHLAIAQHPNAYPALIEWMAQVSGERDPSSADRGVAAVSSEAAAGSGPALARGISVGGPDRVVSPGAASGAASSAATDSAPTAASGSAKRGSGRFWTRTKVIVSGTIAVVGTVASVIGIVPILTRDATNFSHLRIAAEQVESEVTEWALPPESLDLDFPAGEACGPRQIDWLKEHAEPLQRSMVVTARNTASEGAMLALTHFRSSTEGAAERGPVGVRLVCDPSGTLPQQIYYGKLIADDPEASAVQVKLEPGDPTTATPDLPVTFNLAPGESGKIPFELFSRNPSSGLVEVTVLSRDDEQVVEIEGSGFEMPALLYGGEMYLFTTSEGLQCQRVETGALATCTMEELRFEQATARS